MTAGEHRRPPFRSRVFRRVVLDPLVPLWLAVLLLGALVVLAAVGDG